MAGEGRGEEDLSNAEIRVANDQPVVEIGQEITVKSTKMFGRFRPAKSILMRVHRCDWNSVAITGKGLGYRV